jgi:hypothetical protein
MPGKIRVKWGVPFNFLEFPSIRSAIGGEIQCGQYSRSHMVLSSLGSRGTSKNSSLTQAG